MALAQIVWRGWLLLRFGSKDRNDREGVASPNDKVRALSRRRPLGFRKREVRPKPWRPQRALRPDAPTRWIELQPRVNVKDEADLAGARAVLQAITLQPLSQYNGGAAPAPATYNYEVPKMTPGVATSHMQFDDPLQFWSIFSNALNENPPPASEIAAVLPSFKYLGIELGKQWTPASVPPSILAQMKTASAQIGDLALGAIPLAGTLASGWVIPPSNTGFAGTDYLSRLSVAVFGLTANATDQAIYFSGVLDGNNKPMTGAKQYTLTLKPPMGYAKPIAPGFWSVTMYERVTNYTAPNAINRYHLADYDALKRNADGSITLYLQTTSPGPDKQSNCLPSTPGPFYLIFRNYAPSPEVTAALKDRATFQGPPGVTPLGGEWPHASPSKRSRRMSPSSRSELRHDGLL